MVDHASLAAGVLVIGGGLSGAWPELDPYYPWPVRDGQPVRSTSVRGPEYMRVMRARVRRAGVTVLDHHPATKLLLHSDGSVAGASGIRLQEGGTWTCAASAVILATGGTAFLSRLLGANNNTADGHLMAAEAGARFSGMEFSCFYTVAAAHSTMTRAFPFMYGTYRDCDGNELAFESLQGGLPMIALTGLDCQAGVEGLYAAGDVASRQPIVGAASGGGQPNSAWCVASGTWSGRAAANRAAKHPRQAVGCLDGHRHRGSPSHRLPRAQRPGQEPVP